MINLVVLNMSCVQIKRNSLHDSSIYVLFYFPIKDAKKPQKLSTPTLAQNRIQETQRNTTQITYQRINREPGYLFCKSKITTSHKSQVVHVTFLCMRFVQRPPTSKFNIGFGQFFSNHWRSLSRQSLKCSMQISWLENNHINHITTIRLKKDEIYWFIGLNKQ